MNFKQVEQNTRSKKTDSSLPRIGITMGDAAGIGPEIVLKALGDKNLRKICLPIIIGDAAFLKKTAIDLNLKFNFATVLRLKKA